MDEKDIELLTQLMKKAATYNEYYLASLIKDARNYLTAKIYTEWSEEILNNIQKQQES